MAYFVNKSFYPEMEMKTFGKTPSLLRFFPQTFVIHTVKDGSRASEAEADIFLEILLLSP